MRRDFDLVPLGPVEVADYVIADAVDPMVVNVGVFTSDADPVDCAVGIDMLSDDLVLGVDLQFEAEGVGAAAADEGIVDRLERGRFIREDLVVPSCAATISRNPTGSAKCRCRCRHPPGPHRSRRPEGRCRSRRKGCHCPSRPRLCIARAGVEHVVTGHAGDGVGFRAREQGVVACRPVHMIVVGTAARQTWRRNPRSSHC